MAKKKILVADDDADILEVINLILNVKGYEVVTENNGEKLLELKENLPDLLLLDIWMSGMDGRDICRQLKNREETKNLPVIMLSANIDIEAISSECGASGYLAKPFDIRQLVNIIEAHTRDNSVPVSSTRVAS
jgi:DNA-binding response OmpR family regulator